VGCLLSLHPLGDATPPRETLHPSLQQKQINDVLLNIRLKFEGDWGGRVVLNRNKGNPKGSLRLVLEGGTAAGREDACQQERKKG